MESLFYCVKSRVWKAQACWFLSKGHEDFELCARGIFYLLLLDLREVYGLAKGGPARKKRCED